MPANVKQQMSATGAAFVYPNPTLAEKVITAVSDNDLYDNDEPKPSVALVRCVIRSLERLSEYTDRAEIIPHNGEINVTWRAGGRVTKAIFGPHTSTFLLYTDSMSHGNVTPTMVERPRLGELAESLRRLYSACQMCDEESTDIGGLVPDDMIVYRGCSKKNFISETKDAVKENAFWKNGRNHKDGLSLAVTPLASVKNLSKNFGAIRISVAAIHGLAGRGLRVHFDAGDPEHVIIRNLPCMDRDPQERGYAEAVARELANVAQVENAESIIVPAAIPSATENR